MIEQSRERALRVSPKLITALLGDIEVADVDVDKIRPGHPQSIITRSEVAVTGADADDEIRLLHHFGPAGSPRRAGAVQVERVIPEDGSDARLRADDRSSDALGKSDQFSLGAASKDTAPRDDDRPA